MKPLLGSRVREGWWDAPNVLILLPGVGARFSSQGLFTTVPSWGDDTGRVGASPAGRGAPVLGWREKRGGKFNSPLDGGTQRGDLLLVA